METMGAVSHPQSTTTVGWQTVGSRSVEEMPLVRWMGS